MDLLYYSHLIYMCNVCFPILLLRRTETKLEYFADTHIFLKQRHSSYNYTYILILEFLVNLHTHSLRYLTKYYKSLIILPLSVMAFNCLKDV